MTEIDAIFDQIDAQLRRGIPKDDVLVPTHLAVMASIGSSAFMPIGIDGMFLGYRIGYPCRKCGRRKPNKGKKTCDGCGAPK